jgi:hypothetical protein
MQAYRIGNVVIAADTPDEAGEFYRREIDSGITSAATDVDMQTVIGCRDGLPRKIKDIINDVMDERSSWVKMGIPCDLLYPFIITEDF